MCVCVCIYICVYIYIYICDIYDIYASMHNDKFYKSRLPVKVFLKTAVLK